MNRIIFILSLFFVTLLAKNIFAGSEIYEEKIDYSLTAIPPDLLKDANAIVRLKYAQLEIKDESRAVYRSRVAVTIFNKDVQHYGRLSLPYDKFSEIDEIEGTVYDMMGNEVRELDNDEIKDYSTYSDFSLYDDNRVKQTALYYDRFPYTIEFKYEISYDGYLGWPSWYSRSTGDAVQKNIFEVEVPANYEFRYWANSDSIKPAITTPGGRKLYRWQAENLLKFNLEDEDIEDYAAIVYTAPSRFVIDGYQGSMSSWQEFGSWYNMLSTGLGTLPANAAAEVNILLAGTTDNKEKIAKLYKYMQERSRYVSVQLGMGGWRPFSSEYVHQRGYGDCKALSNYMISLLKSAGITAYPVLIKSGDYRIPMITEFPNPSFNHAIVCVPMSQDTVWLECTSRLYPPGFIGTDNENRNALMVTPEGGVVVRTPSSNSVKNAQVKNINVDLSSFEAVVDAKILWTGAQHQYARPVATEFIPEEQEKWISNMLEVPYVAIDNYAFSTSEKYKDEAGLDLKLVLPKYASRSGDRLFFNPNLIERRTYVPKEYPNRRSPVKFSYPYLDVDSLHYKLPADYRIESLPSELKLQSSFAEYTSHTIAAGDSTIIHVRTLEVKEYSIPASSYSEYRKFFADVVKADKNQVVLIKKK